MTVPNGNSEWNVAVLVHATLIFESHELLLFLAVKAAERLGRVTYGRVVVIQTEGVVIRIKIHLL